MSQGAAPLVAEAQNTRGAPAVSSSANQPSGIGHSGKATLAVAFVLLLVLLEASTRVFGWLRGVLPLGADGAVGFAANVALWYGGFAVFALPLTFLERFWPATGFARHYGRALWYWALYMPFALLAYRCTAYLVDRIGWQPPIDIRLEQLHLSGSAELLMNAFLLVFGMVLFDFFFYWFHRLQHRVPLLWRFHRVHHANRYLNAVSCYHHPLEDLWRIPLFMLPMALTFRVDAPQMLLLSGFIPAWAYLSHMDSQLNFGPLVRRVFVDNRYHRIHHSMDPAHFDTNFASYFAPWDWMFGTQRMPRAGEVALAVGLSDVPSPATTTQLLRMPFESMQVPK